eukprot:GILK01008514.1.p1 GENE.GILK01008514.1~~GILK01008514.1.p1  ORF type:complete len:457 (-),score=21.72 GILK01008514.1:48-1418(-)
MSSSLFEMKRSSSAATIPTVSSFQLSTSNNHICSKLPASNLWCITSEPFFSSESREFSVTVEESGAYVLIVENDNKIPGSMGDLVCIVTGFGKNGNLILRETTGDDVEDSSDSDDEEDFKLSRSTSRASTQASRSIEEVDGSEDDSDGEDEGFDFINTFFRPKKTPKLQVAAQETDFSPASCSWKIAFSIESIHLPLQVKIQVRRHTSAGVVRLSAKLFRDKGWAQSERIMWKLLGEPFCRGHKRHFEKQLQPGYYGFYIGSNATKLSVSCNLRIQTGVTGPCKEFSSTSSPGDTNVQIIDVHSLLGHSMKGHWFKLLHIPAGGKPSYLHVDIESSSNVGLIKVSGCLVQIPPSPPSPSSQSTPKRPMRPMRPSNILTSPSNSQVNKMCFLQHPPPASPFPLLVLPSPPSMAPSPLGSGSGSGSRFHGRRSMIKSSSTPLPVSPASSLLVKDPAVS